MNPKVVKMLCCLLFISTTGVAKAEPASVESVKRLMQATGAGEIGVQVANQMMPALKKMLPNAPDWFWEDVKTEINAEDFENLVIPLYQKYLSEEDVTALAAFYNTPAGKKIIQVQPAIMQESMAAGQQWGQQLARKVIMKYRASQEQ